MIQNACLKTNAVSFCEAKTNAVSFCEAKTFSDRHSIVYLSKPFSFNQAAIKSANCRLFFSPIKKCELPLMPISGR